MKKIASLLVAFFLLGITSTAQTSSTTGSTTQTTTQTQRFVFPRNAYTAGAGFLITTGEPGFTALNLFGGIRFKNLELAGEFDRGGTNIELPQGRIKIHETDYLFGPRLYFPKAFSNPKLIPFGHLLFGVAHQNSEIVGGTEESDNAYTWSLGGGVEYHFGNKWAIRGRADLLRTHFVDDTQNHGRFGLGVLYVWGRR